MPIRSRALRRRATLDGLAEIFAQLNISLVVSTYQAGKVILVRYDGGAATTNGHAGTINTHFRNFPSPSVRAWLKSGTFMRFPCVLCAHACLSPTLQPFTRLDS